jgi:hypothetical protein
MRRSTPDLEAPRYDLTGRDRRSRRGRTGSARSVPHAVGTKRWAVHASA